MELHHSDSLAPPRARGGRMAGQKKSDRTARDKRQPPVPEGSEPTESKEITTVPDEPTDPPADEVCSKSASKTRCSVAGIGASAGGLEAFSELLRYLPADTGLAFVLVQHLDPRHESILAELLAARTKMPVIQVKQVTAVNPNHVYVIPPHTKMMVSPG